MAAATEGTVPDQAIEIVNRVFDGHNTQVSKADLLKVLSKLEASFNWPALVEEYEKACKPKMLTFDSFLEYTFSGVPPPPEPVPMDFVLKKEFDEWWPKVSKPLHDLIVERDFVDDEQWASCLVKFITNGLSSVRWIPKDSARAKDIDDEKEYVAEYKSKLGDRTDLPVDNLWKIKLRAEKYIADGVHTAKDPALKGLLQALVDGKEMFKWSQGGFGPKVYATKFLETYANTMISDALWSQPRSRYGMTNAGKRCFLECGIFYIDPGVEYPLHYHTELECYYILAGKTRFVWLLDNNLVYLDREQGEWHFNPPNIPHAITTPHGQPHISLWFREGGPGQDANNKFGPKWIGDVDGMDFQNEKDDDFVPDGKYQDKDDKMVGGLGFKKGSVFREDCDKFLRLLTPTQFEYINNNPNAVAEMDQMLTPDNKGDLQKVIDGLAVASKMQARRRWKKLDMMQEMIGMGQAMKALGAPKAKAHPHK